MITEEKLEKIKKLADAMYYAASYLGPVGSGERLRKTMKEYHQFVIHEYNKEEPESKFEQSIQEGDNIVYNEDLGCRVNLSQLDRVAKKEDSVNNGLDLGCGVIWKEEPVSEELDSFAIKYAQDKPYPVTVCQAVKVGANWQRQQDNNDANHALVEQIKTQQMCYEKGMADMKQQMMKDAIDGQLENRDDYLRIKCLSMSCQPQDDGKLVKLIIIKED